MARRPIEDVKLFFRKFYENLPGRSHVEAYQITEYNWKVKHGTNRYSSFESFRVCLLHHHQFHKRDKIKPTSKMLT